ncbi:MAG: hypothetical protein WEF50_06455 [Myxococcota bacterium]
MRAALVCLLCTAACASPVGWLSNYGLPYSEPTHWPYCVTEVAKHWISYPAQRKRRVDLVCGPKASSLERGLELLGAYSFDRINDRKGGRVRIVLSAQSLAPAVGAAPERADLAAFEAVRLADLLRNPALTATYVPWQKSRAVEVASRSEPVVVRERPWQHVIVSTHEEPDNIWVEDYITKLDDSAVLVLRARYALDVPQVPEKLEKRRALTRSILEGIDVVALP